MRWLVPDPTPEVVRELLAREHPRDTAVKVWGDPAVWEPSFPAGWEADIPVVLMTRRLVGREVPRLHPSYRAELHHDGERVRVLLHHDDGSLGASGQVGLGERTAVPDKVVAGEAHRRRGLGSVVMALLENAAVDRGLRQGVLGATEVGQALYEAVGWSVAGPRTGMYYRP